MSAKLSSWQPTSEMISNKNKKALKKYQRDQTKSLKSVEKVVHNCSIENIFWKFQNIPRKMFL